MRKHPDLLLRQLIFAVDRFVSPLHGSVWLELREPAIQFSRSQGDDPIATYSGGAKIR